MTGRFFRIALAVVALVAVVASCIAYVVLPHRLGTVGIDTAPVWNGRAVTKVVSGGPAAEAGIRTGDVILVAKMDAQDRLSSRVADSPTRYVVERDGRVLDITVVPRVLPSSAFQALVQYAFALIYALIALVVAVKAPSSRATAAIMAFILGIALNHACGGASQVFNTPYQITLVSGIGILFVTAILAGQFGFPVLFPRRTGWVWRSIVVVGVPIWIARCVAYEWVNLRGLFGFTESSATEAWLSIAFTVVVTAAVIDSIRSSERELRAQAAWAAFGIMIPILIFGIYAVYRLLGLSPPGGSALYLLSYASGLAVAYAVLRHRLGGIELFISRAATFSVVSLVLVSTFLLAEWGIAVILERSIGERFDPRGQAILAASIALMVGLSARTVHEVASRRLNRFFFAQRYRSLEALHRFSLETDSAMDGVALTSLALKILDRHVGARYVAIYRGSPEDGYVLQQCEDTALPPRLDADDEVVLRLRRWSEAFINHETTDWFSRAYVCPMTLRGSLRGFVVCGPKNDHAAYLPDERETLATLAHRVGVALEWLGRPESAWRKEEAQLFSPGF